MAPSGDGEEECVEEGGEGEGVVYGYEGAGGGGLCGGIEGGEAVGKGGW